MVSIRDLVVVVGVVGVRDLVEVFPLHPIVLTGVPLGKFPEYVPQFVMVPVLESVLLFVMVPELLLMVPSMLLMVPPELFVMVPPELLIVT